MKQVLLVEDIAAVADTASMMLRSLGYCVTIATNGKDALKQIDTAAHPFDAVITDVLMPEMDGLEFLLALSRRERGGEAPMKVIVTSGGGINVPLDLCREMASPYDRVFIPKPYTLDELKRALEAISPEG